MEWIFTLLIGLIAGMLAKALVPGTKSEPSGWLLTMLLGVAGAFVASLLARTFLGWDFSGSNIFGRIAASTLGAMLLIFLFRMLRR
jgi:uncharacterized membrane protein YeaQ/YmgE (transglycosylase-associated protein family)